MLLVFMRMCCQFSSIHFCRVSVANAIARLYAGAHFPKRFSTDWLLALPLQHFLGGHSKPFDKPEMNPEVLLNSWKITIEEFRHNEPKSKTEAGYVKFEYYSVAKTFVAHLLSISVI